jgi:hypothetical protein
MRIASSTEVEMSFENLPIFNYAYQGVDIQTYVEENVRTDREPLRNMLHSLQRWRNSYSEEFRSILI